MSPSVRSGALALAVLAPVLLAAAPARSQAACPEALARTDDALRATLRRLDESRSTGMARRCEVFRQHVAVMRDASATFRRCTTGRHRQENVGQMDGSIADWQENIARNCR